MDCSITGFPVLHQLAELTQTRVHRVGDAMRIYNGILLGHIKEQNWVICSDVEGSRDRVNEVNQKEENKYQVLMHICCICKNWCRQSSL